MRRWLLPESIEDILPLEARRIERLRRALLDEFVPVSYTHLRAHETVLDLVCRLLLEKKTTTLEAACTPPSS